MGPRAGLDAVELRKIYWLCCPIGSLVTVSTELSRLALTALVLVIQTPRIVSDTFGRPYVSEFASTLFFRSLIIIIY
jgi:hypothetical protein